MIPKKHILPIIVFSQFCGTSLWFSGNAVMPEMISDYGLAVTAMADLTAAVQFGFIIGTLIFALLSVADRYSPSLVFMVCAVIGALCNLGVIWDGNTIETLLFSRFMTGFFLAGIYPVGMKIAADYYDKGLGRSLGFLVGALVLGTAFPHLLRDVMGNFPWRQVMLITSSIAISGGVLLFLFVPNGPFRKAGRSVSTGQITAIFKNRRLRQAAFGYFGHMWELYAFWALVPVILTSYNDLFPDAHLSVGFYSFVIIGIGAVACVLGGFLSEKMGVQKTARRLLLLSAMCCLVSPLLFEISESWLVLVFLCFWGMVVIADSPLFSTLVAQRSEPAIKGTAITIVTCIGFAVTIVSIQLLGWLQELYPLGYILPVLVIGPIFGLWATRK